MNLLRVKLVKTLAQGKTLGMGRVGKSLDDINI